MVEDQTGAAGAPLTVPLREGGPLTLAGDMLSVPGIELPIAELAWVGLVPDSRVTLPDGSLQEGIGVRTRDGGAYYFLLADSDDGPRLLDALFARRLALRDVLPPVAGAFSMTSPDAVITPDGTIPFSPEDTFHGVATADCLVASLTHLSILVLPVGVPLLVWLLTRKRYSYVTQQAKQALVFQAIVTVIYGSVAIGIFAVSESGPGSPLAQSLGAISLQQLSILLVIYSVLAILLALFCLSWMNAALRTFQGKPYHYPFLGWL